MNPTLYSKVLTEIPVPRGFLVTFSFVFITLVLVTINSHRTNKAVNLPWDLATSWYTFIYALVQFFKKEQNNAN